ncbi:MAG: DUF4168 domain-containing protein [wastewater metagenome]|nr:DUF4168 domain-containing protein [Candidatus Loosdrechtia aerotolerans]
MKKMIIKNLQWIIFAICISPLILIPAQRWSQGQYAPEQPTTQTPEQPSAQTEVSDDQVNAIARAQIQIIQIQQKYSAMLTEATDDKERQNVVQMANEEMVAAIQGEGLSVELYNKITTAAQNNPELRKRIYRAMQDLQ